MKKLYAITAFIIFLLSSYAFKANANEGIVELGNSNNTNSRCFAMSTQTGDSSNYKVLIQCTDLVYPIESNDRYYVLWASPSDTKEKTIRVGDLQYGNREFSVSKPFSNLFVTKEQKKHPKTPSKNKIMQGNIKPIAFLKATPTPTSIPTPTKKVTPKPKLTPTITPAKKQDNTNYTNNIKTVLLIFILIITLILIIYIIYKIRQIIISRKG